MSVLVNLLVIYSWYSFPLKDKVFIIDNLVKLEACQCKKKELLNWSKLFLSQRPQFSSYNSDFLFHG